MEVEKMKQKTLDDRIRSPPKGVFRKLRHSELGFSVLREDARYCVWVRYDKKHVIKQININPVTSNGHYPIDRIYIIGKEIKRITRDDEWHVNLIEEFESVNDIPDQQNFGYLDEGAYDGKIIKPILKGDSLAEIAQTFPEITLSARPYKKRHDGLPLLY
jgi:hypothetical protein